MALLQSLSVCVAASPCDRERRSPDPQTRPSVMLQHRVWRGIGAMTRLGQWDAVKISLRGILI